MPDALVGAANLADVLFRIGDELNFPVLGFSGHEQISQLFSFRVELCSEDAEIEFDAVVGQPCLLTIFTIEGRRHVHGIVRRFERTGHSNRLTYYTTEVVPLQWMLTRRIRSRIFQEHNCSDMTVPGIIRKVLEDAGIPSDRYEFANRGEFQAREVVVQYRESEMDFIARLCEEEGIFYYFEHSETKHVLVFGDQPSCYRAREGEPVVFREKSGLVAEDLKEYVYQLRERQEIRVGSAMLDDYDFKHPGQDLRSTQQAEQFTSLEISDAPGGYVERDVGQAWTRMRLEAEQAQRRVQEMTACVRSFVPGFTFSLTDYPLTSANREYVVLAQRHYAKMPQSAEEQATEAGAEYRCEIETIASDVNYRPLRNTPRPFVHGSQTALVVGPPGEEIYTDEYGRVKVQFHWDQDGTHNEHSSSWVRVSQGMAGGGYGHLFLPRVGQEVVVEFLEGNPDRPIVTGRVYNNDHMPAYTLPDEKTKSYIKTHSTKGGGGTNEIRFEDKKGYEQLFFHAEKDLHTRAKASERHTICGGRSVSVGGNQHSKIGGDRHGWVKGDETYAVTGSRWLGIGADMDTGVSGNHALQVGGEYVAGANLIVMEGAMGLCIKGPGGFISIDAAGITIKGNVVLINSGGAALSASYGGQSKQPEEPAAADKATPGQDTTYNVEARALPPLEVQESQQHRTFVEFQLLDVNERPVASEPFVVRLPDGTEQTGTTDAEGKCRFEDIEVGLALISLPNRRNSEWQRVRIRPAEP